MEVPRYEKGDRAQIKSLVGRIWNLRGDAKADVLKLIDTLTTLERHCEALGDMALEAYKELERIEREHPGLVKK